MTGVVFPPSPWAETAPPRPLAPARQGMVETDVAVIGGGFTGLSAAIEVARTGGDVTVLDGKAVAGGLPGATTGK